MRSLSGSRNDDADKTEEGGKAAEGSREQG
jgi:hypothetical protein